MKMKCGYPVRCKSTGTAPSRPSRLSTGAATTFGRNPTRTSDADRHTLFGLWGWCLQRTHPVDGPRRGRTDVQRRQAIIHHFLQRHPATCRHRWLREEGDGNHEVVVFVEVEGHRGL